MAETESMRNMLNVLSPVLGLTANVLAQVFAMRNGAHYLRSIFIGFGAGAAALLAFDVIAVSSPANDLFGMLTVNAIIYSALGYCYFHFLNLGESARRIRIVRELHDAGNGLSLDEILRRYNAQDMVRVRVSRLLHNGQIVCRDSTYHIGKPTTLLIAELIVAMKLFVLGKKSEFDS